MRCSARRCDSSNKGSIRTTLVVLIIARQQIQIKFSHSIHALLTSGIAKVGEKFSFQHQAYILPSYKALEKYIETKQSIIFMFNTDSLFLAFNLVLLSIKKKIQNTDFQHFLFEYT